MQLQDPIGLDDSLDDFVEVDYGVQLIEAASCRDAAGVRRCLDIRADPNFADTRGWTALHAASKLRPAWDVFNLLMPVSDLTARTKTGLFPDRLVVDPLFREKLFTASYRSTTAKPLRDLR